MAGRPVRVLVTREREPTHLHHWSTRVRVVVDGATNAMSDPSLSLSTLAKLAPSAILKSQVPD